MDHASDAHIIAAQRQQKLREKCRKGPAIGDVMRDGTVFAGISPDTGRPMYARPADEAAEIAFIEVDDYTRQVNRHALQGHDDWRVPSLNELHAIFSVSDKGALQGTFNTAATSAYLSSTPNGDINAWTESFSDGRQDFYDSVCSFPVRLIR